MQLVRWNRAGILTAVGAGKQARQILRRIGGAVPDTIVAAPRAWAAVDRIAQRLFAVRQAERKLVPQHIAGLPRQFGHVRQPAPGHIAGITRLDGRHQLPPHRRLDAVGRDQKIGTNFAAVVETRDGALFVMRDRDQRATVAVDIAGPQTKAPPDAIPRRQHLRTRDLADQSSAPRQHDSAFDGDADLVALPGRESQRFVQVVVCGDPRAARAEFLPGSPVDRYLPADLAKEQPREQTANRSPDDDGYFSLPSAWVHPHRLSLAGKGTPTEYR